MIEKWQKALDVGDHARTLLADLSKALNCVENELLLVKHDGLDSRSL